MTQILVGIRVMTPDGYREVVRLPFSGVPQVGHTIDFDQEDREVTAVHWSNSGTPTVTLR